MKRTLRVTLSVDIEDLTDEERDEIADITGWDKDSMIDLSNYSAADLAEPFSTLEYSIDLDDFLAGSEIYAKITDITVISRHFDDAGDDTDTADAA